MELPVYHWQWLCIFVMVMFNGGDERQFGWLLGDEMGLGKVISIDSYWESWDWDSSYLDIWGHRLGQLPRSTVVEMGADPRGVGERLCCESASLRWRCPSRRSLPHQYLILGVPVSAWLRVLWHRTDRWMFTLLHPACEYQYLVRWGEENRWLQCLKGWIVGLS